MRKAVLLGFGCLLSFVLLITFFSNACAQDSRNDFSEKAISLGRIPEGYNAISDSIKFSPDLQHITYAAYKSTEQNIVRLDNQSSPVYYAIQQGTPQFSPDNRHAYIAYKHNSGDAVVVVDWKEDPVIGKVADFMFSPDGQRYAYRVEKDGRQCVVVDGKAGQWYAGIPVKDNFLFSPDSRHIAYVAFQDKSCVLVVDGRNQKHEFQFIQDVAFSPDSKQIAYKARISKKGNREEWCVVHNGEKQNTYDHIFSLVFSQNSEHLSYVAIKDQKMVLVQDGKEAGKHDHSGLPTYSPDSKSFACSFKDGKNFRVEVNEKLGPPFEMIYKFYFSSDSTRHAYIAGDKKGWHCIVDGVVGPKYKIVDAFKFSPDSRRYAYGGVSENGGEIFSDGKSQGQYLSVGEPYFSPDSRHLVFKARKGADGKWITIHNEKRSDTAYLDIGKYHFSSDSRHIAYKAQISPNKVVMVVDGTEQCADKQFALLDEPFFSPDGNHVAYLAADASDNKYRLVVNGHVLPGRYEGFFLGTPMVFDSNNRFHTLGMREPGPEFLLIEVEIPDSIKLTTELKNL